MAMAVGADACASRERRRDPQRRLDRRHPPAPGLTWYNSSKGAVNLMAKSMAVELAPDRIRVNAICPVMGATALLARFMGMPDTPENRKKFIATIPLGRLSRAGRHRRAAVYLASDDAEFITGVEFPVDGGRTV